MLKNFKLMEDSQKNKNNSNIFIEIQCIFMDAYEYNCSKV